ncbi:MAG: glycerol acyltransferase [Phycisphaerae bacterium]|nr:glycerol acyltransferase [Phycisphaerae bacterium]
MRKVNQPRPLHLPEHSDGGPFKQALYTISKPSLNWLLQMQRLNMYYDRVAVGDPELSPFQRMHDTLDLRVDMPEEDLLRIPEQGPLVIVANHPFGAVDAISLMTVLARRRTDVKIIVNRMLGQIELIEDYLFNVDIFSSQQDGWENAGAIRDAIRWVRDGGVLLLFPAGEVSHLSLKTRKVSDPPWNVNAARLIQLTRAPVVPIYFDGANSRVFQAAGLIHPRLRTALLPREMFKKKGRSIRMRIGHEIDRSVLQRHSDPRDLIRLLRVRTYVLRSWEQEQSTQKLRRVRHKRDHDRDRAQESVPRRQVIDQDLICDEFDRLTEEHCIVKHSDFTVYCARYDEIPNSMKELGRLREESFRMVGEGTGKAIDLDSYDRYYRHLVLYDHANGRIAGGYRMGLTDEILPARGVGGLYTHTLFDYGLTLVKQLDPAIELGRSFVRKDYQRHPTSLMLLWKAIGVFAARTPRYRRLFGPVSISSEYHSMSRSLLIWFLRSHHFLSDLSTLIRPRNPVSIRPMEDWDDETTSLMVEDIRDVDALIREIEQNRRSVPVLLRQYLKLNAKLLGVNLDPKFGNVIDGLLIVDLLELDPRILERYVGRDGAEILRRYHGHDAGKA